MSESVNLESGKANTKDSSGTSHPLLLHRALESGVWHLEAKLTGFLPGPLTMTQVGRPLSVPRTPCYVSASLAYSQPFRELTLGAWKNPA